MIIGITGTLASGKSTVAKLISEAIKAKIFDADKIVHLFLEQDKEMNGQIVAAFSAGVKGQDGKIDRKKLAEVVFSDREKIKRLCEIIHPKVIEYIRSEAKKLSDSNPEACIIIDAPLLIESKLDGFCDLVITVSSPIEKILERASKYYGLDNDQALRRIRTQIPSSEKEKHADFVIYNKGTKKELSERVREFIKEKLQLK